MLPLLLLAAALAQAPSQNPPQTPTPPPPHHITAAEASELFRSVDDILAFVSTDTGLPIKSSVKRELAARDQVQRYVEEKLNDDEDERRMEQSELVLKKFGMLPRDFALKSFMVQMLREQVAGYYDPKRKTVFLLDWVAPEAQKPILAHELTHALQDQDVDLDKWSKTPKPQGATQQEKDNSEVAFDEDSSARTALVEGQGMAVLIDYYLAPANRSLADSPQVLALMMKNMDAPDDQPLIKNAPLLLRESMLFPYRDGVSFVAALLTNDLHPGQAAAAHSAAVAAGRRRAYADALASPPRDTRAILMPQTFLAGQRVIPPPLPDLAAVLGKDFERYDVGAVGEFDTLLFCRQFATPEVANQLSPEWRGGVYYAALRHGAHTPHITADLTYIYKAAFSSPDAAARFAKVYAGSLSRRYAKAQQDAADPNLWHTSEGDVRIDTLPAAKTAASAAVSPAAPHEETTSLLILEGFDPPIATAIRNAFTKLDAQPPIAAPNASPKSHPAAGDLALRLVAPYTKLPLTFLPHLPAAQPLTSR